MEETIAPQPQLPPVDQRDVSGSMQDLLINAPSDAPQQTSGPALPSVWVAAKFILKCPMQCSRLRSHVTVFLGVLSSVAVGGCLAGIGILISSVFSAISNSDEEGFNRLFSVVVIILASAVLAKTCSEYCMRSVGLLKRSHLNSRLQAMYISRNNFYVLNALPSAIDNADSRISSESEQMFREFFNVVAIFLTQATLFIAVSAQIFQRSAFARIGVLAQVCFACICLPLAKRSVGPVTSAVCNLKQRDGNFNFQHSRVKKYCESIAFYAGHERERDAISKTFNSVLAASRICIRKQFWLDLVSNVFLRGVNSNFPVWIGYITAVSAGVGSAAEASQDFIFSSSLLVFLFIAVVTLAGVSGPLSSALGCAQRVLHLLLTLEQMSARSTHVDFSSASDSSDINTASISAQTQKQPAEGIDMVNVCVIAPNSSTPLCTGFNLRVPVNTIIMGPSGCGKSSVLRVIAGLWPSSSGSVTRPPVGRSGLCFLPQRPYMCPGSLRSNVTYPSTGEGVSDEEVRKVLVMAGLSNLSLLHSNLDAVQDWGVVLSLGEQQRVAFARCFFMKPSVVILDESTSALDPENEDLMYSTLLRLGIHFVSVGHRSQLKAYHCRLVMFDGRGGFESHELTPPVSRHGGVDPSADHVAPSGNSSNDAKDLIAPINVEISISPPHRSMYMCYLHILRLCFFQRASLKNLMMHCIIFILFSLSFTNTVLFITPITSDAQLFRNISAEFTIRYLFFAVIITALLDAIINSALAYVTVRMRKNLTRGLETAYFSNKAYYKLSLQPRVVDPQGPIVRDISDFTSTLTSVLWRPCNLTSLGSANLNSTSVKDSSLGASVAYAIVVTVAISYEFQGGLSLQLVWTGVGYCIAGIICILLPIVNSYARATQRASVSEAAFRAVHSRFRLHSETIALYSAESIEAAEMTRTYADVLETQRRFIFWQSAFQGLQILFRFGPTCVGLLLLKDSLFVAARENSFAAARIILNTTLLFYQDLLGSFFYAGAASEAAGYGKRISELLESLWATKGVNDPENDNDDLGLEDDDSQAIEKIKRSDAAPSVTSSTSSTAGESSPSSSPPPPIVHLQDITITNPSGATLLRSLNLSLSANESCVIVGPSGCGKSSLLRVMARLWQPASDTGSIVLPSKIGEGGVFFLPQRPYMINASLRAEILYPSLSELSGAVQGVVDDRIKELFKTFDLGHLLQLYGLETVRNWDDVLSLGEQQRVAMVRLMLHKPSVVMLDECTSAVDEHQQQMFYKLLRDQGMCFISVGHRPELLRLHDKVLRLDGRGSYTLLPVGPI